QTADEIQSARAGLHSVLFGRSAPCRLSAQLNDNERTIMFEMPPFFMLVGAFAFGAVIGWITYFIMRRAQPTALTDIATLIGTLGGAAILTLFEARGPMFAAYAIGLAVGFFAYFAIYSKIVGITALRESLTKQQADGSTVME